MQLNKQCNHPIVLHIFINRNYDSLYKENIKKMATESKLTIIITLNIIYIYINKYLNIFLNTFIKCYKIFIKNKINIIIHIYN